MQRDFAFLKNFADRHDHDGSGKPEHGGYPGSSQMIVCHNTEACSDAVKHRFFLFAEAGQPI